jgi:DNA-binding NarL/FixJ family response regulator
MKTSKASLDIRRIQNSLLRALFAYWRILQPVFPRDLALGRPISSPSFSFEPLAGDRLSYREREVLSYLVNGYSNKEIARHLGVTEATAKVDLKNLLRKIRLENRTQAVIWALANMPELKDAPRGLVSGAGDSRSV